MATIPYFVFSPSTILSLSGILRGPDPIKATPAEDWRDARIDVVIPALNEAENIVLCLASVLHQTVRPRRIFLIDDGSTDDTVERAKSFCRQQGVELTAIQRGKPIGKTPTLKRQARELDSDVEFVLDADTVLESTNYIERTVQELYQAVGIASAFGTILPQRKKDRRDAEHMPGVRRFLRTRSARSTNESARPAGWIHDAARGVTNVYREVLYLFLQRIIYRGQIGLFGTTSNPVGCAVAYRRKYVHALFEHISPILGDDLTNSEDIFIGFSMLNEGYRNVQLNDVYARTVEPEVHRLPRQMYLWSSAFLQSCYYFDPLLRSPLKVFSRWASRRHPGQTGPSGTSRRLPIPVLSLGDARMPALATIGQSAWPEEHRSQSSSQSLRMGNATAERSMLQAAGWGDSNGSGERRVIREPYRQPFGRARTEECGRPAGWVLALSAVEKVFLPASLLIMAILGMWEALAVTAIAETAICLFALCFVMKGRRLEYLLKGLLGTPVRYALVGVELLTIGRFATDIWITKNRKWRK